MRILMILTSLASYFVNDVISKAAFGGKKEFNFEQPLTNLVLDCVNCFHCCYFCRQLLSAWRPHRTVMPIYGWALGAIISCGTIAGALIPEFTKVFHQHFFSSLRRSCQRLQARRSFFEHSFRSGCR